MGRLIICDHPLIQHKLTFIRKKETNTKDFRDLVDEVATMMAYELTREIPLQTVEIDTPVAKSQSQIIDGRKLGIIPILRAGLGMVDGFLKLVPAAKIGHIGMARDHETLQPKEYYLNLPADATERLMVVIDPMLATGGSAIAAISTLKDKGCKHIKLMCLIAAPEGVEALQQAHPDVDLYIASLDERLDEHGYIIPGLGDAGDRMFGTN